MNENFERFIDNKEIKMTSKDLCEIINEWRAEEGNRKELKHKSLMTSINKELETLKSLNLKGGQNILPAKIIETTYKDLQGKDRPCYLLDRDMIILMASKESTYVRIKLIEYIKTLETFIEESGLSEDFLYYRRTGKIIRRTLTDTIQRVYGDLKEFKYIYAQYTNLVYDILFDMSAKEIRVAKGLKKSDKVRDNFTSDELDEILALENKIKSLIEVYEMEGTEINKIFDRVSKTIRKVYHKEIIDII